MSVDGEDEGLLEVLRKYMVVNAWVVEILKCLYLKNSLNCYCDVGFDGKLLRQV